MDRLLNTLKCIYNIFVNIIQFVAAVQNWFVRYGVSGVVDFHSRYGI